MAETFSFREGGLHLWTGHHTASGNVIAFVENVNLNADVEWQSDPAVDGTYRAHITNKRLDFSFTVAWEYGGVLPTLHAAQTACHLKLIHNLGGGLGSAGVHVYSAVIPGLSWGGAQAGVMQQTVNGFGHSWSAF